MEHSAEYMKLKSEFNKQWLSDKEVHGHQNFSSVVLYDQQQREDFLRSPGYLQYLALEDSLRAHYLHEFNVPQIMEVIDLLIEHNLVPENFIRKRCEYDITEELGCSATCWRILREMITKKIDSQFELERLQSIIEIMVRAGTDFDPEICLSIGGSFDSGYYVYKRNP